MGGERWPAIAIQGVLLAANISFLLSPQSNGWIVASTIVLMLLFTIQTVSKNKRFMYLFPMRTITVPVPNALNVSFANESSSYDTLILRGLIVLSAILWLKGATDSIFFSLLIVALAIGFPKMWDRSLNRRSRNRIAEKLSEKTPNKFTSRCMDCLDPADYEYNVEKSDSGYKEIIKMTCKGKCEDKGTRIIQESPFE